MKEISFETIAAAAPQAAEEARAEAHATGLPYSFGEDGRVFRVYPDGRRTEVIRDGAVNIIEIEFSEE